MSRTTVGSPSPFGYTPPDTFTPGAGGGTGSIHRADPAKVAAAEAAAAAPQPPNEMTAQDAANLKARIEKISGLPNPFSEFPSYTYKFRLFMAQDDDFVKNLYGGTSVEKDISPSEVFNAIDNSPQITIAQSGVTAGINIRDVRMEQVVGPSDWYRNTNMTMITMQIDEPLGTSLMEVMRDAALELRVRNLDKAPYFLELTFIGYDEFGDPITNLLETDSLSNGGRWLYEVQITNIDTELDSQGSRYTLSLRPHNETAIDDYLNIIPSMCNFSGPTIEQFLKNFADDLNKVWAYYYGREIYTFEFKLHEVNNLSNQNAGQFKITSVTPEQEDVRNYEWKNGSANPTLQVYSGTSIQQVIEHLFASTDQAVEIAKAVKKTMTVNESKSLSTAELFRKAVLFRIEPDVDLGVYDPIIGNYHKHITFHIWGYYSQAMILSQAQEQNAKEPAVQAKMVQELLDKGFFRKRYDYLFTGLNTEVLRLDIKYNLAWSVALPSLAMYGTDIEQIGTNAKVGDQYLADVSQQKKYQELMANTTALYEADQGSLLAIGKQLQSNTISDAERAELTRQKSELEKKAAESQKALAALRASQADVQARVIQQDQDIRASRTHQGKWRGYAEDLDSTPSVQDTSSLPLLISYREMRTAEGKNLTGTGYAKPVSGERGIYGAILEQVYGPLTTGLVSIEMEVRGDPYWLSYSNIERRLHMRAASPLKLSDDTLSANYVEGDNVIQVHFKYPYKIDADTGDLTIRPGDKFNGLYRVTRVVHQFTGGEFRQTLTGARYTLVDVARALSYDGVEGGGGGGVSNETSPSTPPTASDTPARTAQTAAPASGPRGIRNNNPGNIVTSSVTWQGQVGTDGRFIRFDTAENGIRALSKNLLAKQDLHGLRTVSDIIGDPTWGWAPAADHNDPVAYSREVARALGVSPTDTIDLHDPRTLRVFTTAVIRVENGKQPYSAESIQTGVNRALGGN